MRIAIIGAGIAGVTTAFELASEGHEVSVFERRGSVAAEGSFANSGLLAPGLALPLIAPAWPAPGGNFSWRMQQWKAARQPQAAARAEALHHLAVYSHARLQSLRRSLQLDFESAEGLLLLARTAREREAIAAGLERLQRLGLAAEELDTARCHAREPGLNEQTPLHAGIALKPAEIGNCRQLVHLLRVEAQRLGARWRFDTTVRAIEPGGQLVHEHAPMQALAGAVSNGRPQDAGDTLPAPLGPQQERFDAIVVCAGTEVGALLAPLGLKLPLRAITTHSLTAPLRQLEAHPDLGPRGALVDLQHDTTISRIGQRVRLVGRDESRLHKVLHDWFPGAIQSTQVQRWSGTHVQVADHLPLLGKTGIPGVWLHAAASDSGWSVALGAARVIADGLGGRGPEVDVAGLGVERFA
ncbi:MAG: FAD-dependent oxidoreductase [Paucibacter sp.]|nr:FAD-dependent oxidoreductase [Roseateles sp.]